jgi:F-type H+-transporting ATPase subunit delta
MAQLPSIRRYAAAAFQLALEQDKLDKWRDDLSTLAEMWSDPDLHALLTSPAIPPGDKLKVVHDLTPGAEPLVHNLVGVMLSNGLVSSLPQVAAVFQGLLDADRGHSRATITTAVEVDKPVIGEIQQWLETITGKKLIAQSDVEPVIIGGFVARVGDRLVDASTRNRLLQLREKMSAGEASS